MSSPKAIFIGMPGVGKSAVGKRVARQLNLNFADSDWLIEERARKSVEEIFAQEGEATFRKIEAEVIADALKDFDGILSLGGGAVTTASTRELLKDKRVILIEAQDQVLAARLRNSPNIRPILADDIETKLAEIRRTRLPLYRSVVDEVLISNFEPVFSVVDDAIATINSTSSRIIVSGTKNYNVVIGHHLTAKIIAQAQKFPAAMIIYSPDVQKIALDLAKRLRVCSVRTTTFSVPAGEDAKNVETLAKAWEHAGENHLGRDGLIITVGGGATTDLGGFVAATWLRGVAVMHLPTTLLGMVDAAVGGKTGINTQAGKNLAGAFYPPIGVYCDLDALATLPAEEILAGMGEVLKCGFIKDREIIQLVATHGRKILQWNNIGLAQAIQRAIAVKAEVVSKDLYENGMREILNYGHTLAHAIERAENYQRRHGEAVAIGCIFASALAEAANIAQPGFTKLHHDAFLALGLPVEYPQGNAEELLHLMESDKKVRKNNLRFVVLSEIGKPQILEAPNSKLLAKAFEAIGIHS